MLKSKIKERGLLLWPPIVIATLVAVFLHDYFVLDMKMVLGLVIFFILISHTNAATSKRLLWLLIPLLILSLFVHLKFLYTLCLFTFLLLIIEYSIGKVSILSYAIIFIISPLFTYLTSFFSLDLRIGLSKVVAFIFTQLGMSASSSGSIISLNGNDFTVDPACAGLHMLSFSLLLGIFIIDYVMSKKEKKLNIGGLLILAIFLLGLIIISNLIRIASLTYFGIPAATLTHQLVGLLAIVVYTLIPFYFIANAFIGRLGKDKKTSHLSIKRTPAKWYLIFVPIFIFAGTLLSHDARGFKTFGDKVSFKGYNKEWVNPEVLKLYSKDNLIYYKMVKSFYGIEHNPLVCWKGSGFELSKVEKKSFPNAAQISTGILNNKKNKLYTAWWFENGNYRTSDALTWRWKVISGEPNFYLVNVTASSKKELLETINKLTNL